MSNVMRYDRRGTALYQTVVRPSYDGIAVVATIEIEVAVSNSDCVQLPAIGKSLGSDVFHPCGDVYRREGVTVGESIIVNHLQRVWQND